MSAPVPIVLSSGTAEGNTTIALATLVPYSSDGPTLPIIASAGEPLGAGVVSGAAMSSRKQDPSRGNGGEEGTRKKQKENIGTGEDDTSTRPSKPPPKMDLEPLHKPWALLPPEILRTIELRLGRTQWWEENCIPVVFTKNQNIKSGINRLKAYLEYEQIPGSTVGLPDKVGKEGLLIAVSAQGEATTKLVGIVEMLRRVVNTKKDKEAGGGGKVETWYLYTSLASRVVERPTKNGGAEEKDAGRKEKTDVSGDGDGDFEMRDADHVAEQGEVKSKKTPVLTAWISKRSIPEYKKAFGEQTFEVQKPKGED